MDEMDEIVQEFLVESHENLDALDTDLVALEQDPGSRDLLSSIFRTIHTIKGTSGFLAFGKLESITHVGETLLSKLRDGALVLTPEVTSALLLMVDVVRAILRSIEDSGGEGDLDIAPAVAAVEACLAPLGAAPAAAPAAAGAAAAPPPTPVPVPVVAINTAEITSSRLGDILVQSYAASPDAVEEAVRRQMEGDERTLGEILVETGAAAPDAINEALEHQHRRTLAESTVRVDVAVLDTLMRLVGELVLTRNQIAARTVGDHTLAKVLQRLSQVTGELQTSVMRTRMQPLDTVWNKFPRVVRDLSLACGKNVHLEMVGRETELDRTLIEAIKDPLTHIVRNSVDHGIETPAARVAAGKPETGRLTLSAYHEGGRVVISITDDGLGIDTDRVLAKALERGIISPAEVTRMTQRDIMQLVFRPGFSTAATITNVSGRGVGMDVVRTNVERIGGTVELESTPGQGTTCRLIIPLTLAIIPALTLAAGNQRYATPQSAISELVRIEPEDVAGQLLDVSGSPAFRLRDRLLPLLHLADVLGVERPLDSAGVNILVLDAQGRQFGLVVDQVLDNEEIVVKPLSRWLEAARIYSGVTMLADGLPAPILDIPELSTRTMHIDSAVAAGEDDGGAGTKRERLLVARVGGDRRVVIPLQSVSRLAQYPVSSVEHVGTREVIQHDGRILPLVRLGGHIGSPAAGSAGEPTDTPLDTPVDVAAPDEAHDSLVAEPDAAGWRSGSSAPAGAAGAGAAGATMLVVVHTRSGRSVALQVDSVVDIVEELVDRQDVEDSGLTGSAILQDRVSELLDVRRAILAADPHFYVADDAPAGAGAVLEPEGADQ